MGKRLLHNTAPQTHKLLLTMAAVKSLYTIALENVPPYPSPSKFAENYLPKCHALYEPLYNLYYEEERQRYRSEHEMSMK